MRHLFLLSGLALIASLSVGCSSSSDSSTPSDSSGGAGAAGQSGGGGQGGSVGAQPVSVPIKAADGGKVTAPGVSLDIPAGALSADTTITVAQLDKTGQPDADKIASPVFQFGPDGTQFSKPVPMTLDFAGTAPMGTTPVIAYLDPSTMKWTPLADSKVSGTQVTASTTHFSTFTVIWSNGMQTGGGCSSLQFTPCGGDLTGTWKFTAACADLPPNTDPTNGGCPSATVAATVDFEGQITFNSNATYSLSDTQSINLNWTIPKTCLKSGQTCQALSTANNHMFTNIMDTGTDCTAQENQAPKMDSESGTYTTSGTTFTTVKMGSTSGDPADYCVSGTMASVRVKTKDGVYLNFVVQKQ